MRLDAEQVLCRFQLTSLTRHHLGSLFEWIVHVVHRQGLQGVTVFEGFYGSRTDGTIISAESWALRHERPIIVEVIDEPDQIATLLAIVEPEFTAGAITLERTHIVMYRTGGAEPLDLHIRNIPAAVVNSRATGVTTMKMLEDGVLLRIFIGENDRARGEHRPLYETLVQRAHEQELRGATVLRGQLGFGRHATVHAAKFLELSTNLPIVVELVDTEARIQAFLPVIDELVSEGMATLESVRLARYP